MSGATWTMKMLDIEAIKTRIEQSREDASEFLQHAPADLEALIAEIEELREIVDNADWHPIAGTA